MVAGQVRSSSDGQIHNLTANTLIRLYGVRPAECATSIRQLEIGKSYIHLVPKHSGNYAMLPDARKLVGIQRSGGKEYLKWE